MDFQTVSNGIEAKMKKAILIILIIGLGISFILLLRLVVENDTKTNSRVDSLIVAAHHADSVQNAIHKDMLNDEVDCDSIKDLKDYEQDSILQILDRRSLPLVNWKP